MELGPQAGTGIMTIASISSLELLNSLGGFDPAPFFGISLLPYLAFLWWSWRSKRMPRLALWGFAMTLVFVAVTIVAAVVAERVFAHQLADVDVLHGGAEVFLTLSNVLVLIGFSRRERPQASGRGAEHPAVNKS
jgi:heme A synthase